MGNGGDIIYKMFVVNLVDFQMICRQLSGLRENGFLVFLNLVWNL